jgi:hypothetical protein
VLFGETDDDRLESNQLHLVDLLGYFAEMKNITDFSFVSFGPTPGLGLLVDILKLMPHVSNIFLGEMCVPAYEDISDVTASPQVKRIEIECLLILSNYHFKCAQVIFSNVREQCTALGDFIIHELNDTAFTSDEWGT